MNGGGSFDRFYCKHSLNHEQSKIFFSFAYMKPINPRSGKMGLEMAQMIVFMIFGINNITSPSLKTSQIVRHSQEFYW